MIKRNSMEYASACIIAFSAFITLWLFLKYAALALLPLAAALLVSSVVRPIAGALGKKSHASTKICGGILVFLVVFAAVYGFFCLGIKFAKEMTEFIASAVEGLEREDNLIRRIIDFSENIRHKFPIFSTLDSSGNEGISDEIYSVLIESAKRTATSLSEKVTSIAASFIKAMPDFIFSVVVFIISLLYLTMDYDGVKSVAELQVLCRGISEPILF